MMSTTAEDQRQSPVPILVVEDSDEDYEIFLRALRKLPETYDVARCCDGDECLDYLEHTGIYAEARPARPSLILLDLNLPGTDGWEVLDRLDREPDLRSIPVTILTTSTNPADVRRSYTKGANSYATKSQDWRRYEVMVRDLMDFWFRTVMLPTDIRAGAVY